VKIPIWLVPSWTRRFTSTRSKTAALKVVNEGRASKAGRIVARSVSSEKTPTLRTSAS